MAEEFSGGDHGPPAGLGSYKAVTRKLLRQYYHKLGSYLHASMREGSRDPVKSIDFLRSAAARVEQYCRGTTVVGNLGCFHTVHCSCGRTIKRNARAVALHPYIKCPNEQCGAEFDLVSDVAQGARWRLRQTTFVCPSCNTSNVFGSHLVNSGVNFTCVECHDRYAVVTDLIAIRIENAGSTKAL